MLELTGSQVVIGLVSLGAAIIIGIILYRLYHHQINKQSDNDAGATIIKLSNRTKYANKSFLRQRGQRLGVGLASSLLFSLMAISWTVYEKPVYLGNYNLVDEVFEIIPRTVQEPPALPPPPKPVEIEIIDDDIIVEEPDDLSLIHISEPTRPY